MKINDLKKHATTNYTVGISSALLLIFVIVSFWLIFEFAKKERSRDLLNWQSRLALLAEIRTADVEDWIDKRKYQLDKLSTNATLSLFLSQLANKEKFDGLVLQAQQGHVRNLLRARAQLFGFANDTDSSSLPKMTVSGEYGIAILGVDQQLVMASRGFPANISRHKNSIDIAYKKAAPMIIDIYAGQNKQPVYGYISPVFRIQDNTKRAPVGAIMVLLNPQINLYNILKNRQSITATDETLLVKRSAASLEYISPIKGEFNLFHKLPDNNNQLASSYAYHNPGGFAQMRDYRGVEVLVTGRKLRNSNWRLVQKISAAEALHDSDQHQSFLITTFSLLVVIIALAFIAVWRHSTGNRLQLLSRSLETHIALLNAVTENIKENIVLLDSDFRIIFINPVFASSLDLSAQQLKGRRLSNVLGKEAEACLQNNAMAEDNVRTMSLTIDGQNRQYHVSATALKQGEYKNAALFVLHDISELKREQEKRESLSQGVITTLVRAVDLYDPFCANHSVRTREVALEIARHMNLSTGQLELLAMASLLANIGKLFVPKEILTKMQRLTEEESQQLRKHISYAVDILSELSFDGPVVKIIAQKTPLA